MPTLDIASPELTLQHRRRAALRLTRWFASRQATAAHVVIRFHAVPPDSVFAAGIALSSPNRRSDDADERSVPFAMVSCCIAVERDADFRKNLALELQQALEIRDSAFLYVRFEPVDRQNVFYSIAGHLVSADQ